MMEHNKMKRILYMILSAAALSAALLSCQREFEVVNELAVSSRTLELKSESGSTHILVYANGPWTVRFDQKVEWASLNKLSGEGFNDFTFSWSANYGVKRGVNILLETEEKTEKISIIQAGVITSPNITFERSKIALPRQAATFRMPMTTNLAFCLDEIKARAVYYDAQGRETGSSEIGQPAEGAWVNAYTVDADQVTFDIAENNGGADRRADIIYYVKDAAGSESRSVISLTQSRLDPAFTLSSESGSYYANQNTYEIAATQNNIWSSPESSVTVSGDWVTDAALTEDGLSFSVDENGGTSSRSATITVAYAKGGHSAGATYRVQQSADKLITFSELREMTPGAISRNDYLEGWIVSDPDSKNVCSSPQTGQFAFDRTENARTAYLESTDGNYGLQLKFTAADQNVQPRWAKVLINLNGTTLVREDNPVRYTVRGLTSAKISLLEQGDATTVPRKTRSVSQLNDNDIFTYVSLSPIEIMCKDGAFTNVSEGYAYGGAADAANPSGSASPRWDVAPLLCSDDKGDVIYMLTNAAVPWRRTGRDIEWNSCVPQGAGTLSGIIVADEVAPVRWGNLGKYQIRAMTLGEIDLLGERFSNTICEWTWNDFSPKITPDEGHGTFNKYNAGTEFVSDFNNPYFPADATSPNGNSTTTNMKGLVTKAAICLKQQWWDFTENTGRYFDIKFSTAGLSGTNLIFGIVWGHGSMDTASIYGPSHWNVLYSVDNGANFSPVPSVDILKKRSVVWWGSGTTATSQDSTPGFTEHLVKLPAACFGQSNVVVRLQVADTVTDTVPSTSASTWQNALGIERGTLTSGVSAANCQVRIGTITVRYN